VSGAKSSTDDVLDLLDHAWGRRHDRMQGLADEGWTWCPSTTDAQISIRWRLEHLTRAPRDPRNWSWLAAMAPAAQPEVVPGPAADSADSAASAVAELTAGYAGFRSAIGDPATDLSREIGPAAGPFTTATRRSFVLHIVDGLIHHGAEAALLRDLYPSRPLG
jgi:hypothetical protein